MIIKINPEIQRYIWIELSLHRLIAMPIILGLIFTFVYIKSGFSIEEFSLAAILLYLGLTLLWGTRLTTESILSEKIQKTWDWQRLSGINAWTLTFGKLFGSTIFIWYGAIICFIVYFIGLTEADVAIQDNTMTIFLLLLLLGILAQTFSMMLSLQWTQYESNIAPRYITVLQIILLLSLMAPISFLIESHNNLFQWYNHTYNILDFSLLSGSFFLFWNLLGIYHLMRSELQFRSYPWIWLAFIFFIYFYSSGFITLPYSETIISYLFLYFIITIILHYAMLIFETKKSSQFQRLFISIKNKQFINILAYFPQWGWNLILLGILYILILFNREYMPSIFVKEIDYPMLYLLAICLFIIRDTALVIWLSLNPRSKKPEITAILYLFILYFLIPHIFAATDQEIIKAFFLPLSQVHWGLLLIPVTLEILVLFFLIHKGWQKFLALQKY